MTDRHKDIYMKWQ